MLTDINDISLPQLRTMDIKAIRRKNLLNVIEEKYDGVKKRLATDLDIADTQLTHIFSKNPKSKRNIGNKLARKVELVAGYPEFWMDKDHANDDIDTFRIPLIEPRDIDVANTEWKPTSSEEIPSFFPHGQRTYAIRLTDDAMAFNGFGHSRGDPVIIDPDEPLKSESVCLVKLSENQFIVRRYIQIVGSTGRLHSINKEFYPAIDIDLMNCDYLGTVVEIPAKLIS